jgi:imidazolonepropionase-like amidohydrolase
MKVFWCAFFLAACGASAPTVSAPAPAPPATRVVDGDLAFVHARVVPMDKNNVLPDQTVVVQGDRIVALGPSATLTPGPRARVIDASGAYLMPGLSDLHAHLNDAASLTLLVANGVTTVRNMWGTRQALIWRDEIKRGARLGPSIFTAGPIVDGSPPQWDGSVGVANAAEAIAAVDAQHDAGYDFIKVYNHVTPEAFDAIVAEAAKLGMHVGGHVPVEVGLERALASHFWTIEHLTGYFDAAQRDDSPLRKAHGWKERTLQSEYLDESKLAALVRATAAAGTTNCPTLVVLQKFVPPDEGRALLARPEMRFMAPLTKASWDPAKDYRTKDWTAADYAAMRHGDALRARLVRDLHAAGARLVTGTDFPNPFVVPGFSLHEELALLVAAGLSPYDALRASTADAAELLGGDFGVVAEGKRADLLLVDGNPLDDVANAARRRGVVVRGTWLTETELAARLEPLAEEWDESNDRLAKLPALPGALTFTVRFSSTFLGKERLVRAGHVVLAQAVSDDAEPADDVTESREEMDARGGLASLELRRDAGAVKLSGHLVVENGRLVGTVEVTGQPMLAVDESFGDAIFATTPTRTWQLAVERARARRLGVGKALVVQTRDVDLEPRLHVVALTETVKRLPDADQRQRYAVDEKRPNGTTHAEVTLGADGGIEAVHAVLQIGELDFTRDPAPR